MFVFFYHPDCLSFLEKKLKITTNNSFSPEKLRIQAFALLLYFCPEHNGKIHLFGEEEQTMKIFESKFRFTFEKVSSFSEIPEKSILCFFSFDPNILKFRSEGLLEGKGFRFRILDEPGSLFYDFSNFLNFSEPEYAKKNLTDFRQNPSFSLRNFQSLSNYGFEIQEKFLGNFSFLSDYLPGGKFCKFQEEWYERIAQRNEIPTSIGKEEIGDSKYLFSTSGSYHFPVCVCYACQIKNEIKSLKFRQSFYKSLGSSFSFSYPFCIHPDEKFSEFPARKWIVLYFAQKPETKCLLFSSPIGNFTVQPNENSIWIFDVEKTKVSLFSSRKSFCGFFCCV